jgi:hypothetical protein
MTSQPVADIVQRGPTVTNDSGNETYESSRQLGPQVIDFIGLTELARRTGRFPQLVDPRSRVNGLLLRGSPGFREMSLEKRRTRCRLTRFTGADAYPPVACPRASSSRSVL